MILRRKKAPKKRYIDQTVVKRASRMSAHELFTAMDSTLMGLSMIIDQYRFHDAPGSEVGKGIDAIHAIWDELLTREQ